MKRSNSLHTKWPPVRTMDMATRNWQRYSCLDRISWMFSCPSTLNPPSAIIKWTPRTNKKFSQFQSWIKSVYQKKFTLKQWSCKYRKIVMTIDIWSVLQYPYGHWMWKNIEAVSIPLRYWSIFQYRYQYFFSKTPSITSFIKQELSI